LINTFFNPQRMKLPPPVPRAYDGVFFENTTADRGWGKPTFGKYDVEQGTWSGYKPFGALGQGLDVNLGVSLDTSTKPRIMLFTLMPTNDYN